MSLSFRRDLEGLRGLAILLVVAFHAKVPGFKGGYIGVDVFFVLSGFLITSLLTQKFDATGRVHFVEFYARRARRLLPAAAIVMGVTILAGRLVYAPFEQQEFMGTAVATALYGSNIWFTTHAMNYWAADSAVNPFLHTWSLAVEEQFYLVWPLLLASALSLGPAGSRRRRLAIVMGVMAALSLAAGVWLTAIAQPLAFFSSPTRAWEFGVGGLGALFTANRAQARGWLGDLLAWAGLVAICASAALFTETTAFPGIAVLLPVLGTVIVLTQYSPAAEASHTRVLSGSVLQWFGRLSYSWYLWHWPVLLIGTTVAGTTWFPVRLACVTLALLLAWVTFHLIEHPIRSSKALARRPQLSLALAASLTVVSVSAAWSARVLATRDAEAPAQRAFTMAQKDGHTGCHTGFLDAAPTDCVFGDVHASTTVVLFGDSHAAQWFPAMERLANERHWKFVSMTKSACPAAAIEPFDTSLGRRYVECSQWRSAAVTRIIALHPAIVVMASASRFSVADPQGTPRSLTADQWLTGTAATLSTFSAAGLNTALMADTPWPGFEVPACLARAAWNPTVFSHGCSFARDAALKPTFAAAEVQAAARTAGTSVLDVNDAVCGAPTCEATRGDTVIYLDSNHLTATFARSLAPLLAAKLDAVWSRERASY